MTPTKDSFQSVGALSSIKASTPGSTVNSRKNSLFESRASTLRELGLVSSTSVKSLSTETLQTKPDKLEMEKAIEKLYIDVHKIEMQTEQQLSKMSATKSKIRLDKS
jgi:hypothetical protein